jgi:protein-tyrosine phosphatase
MRQVLFVCTGNVFRSLTAEYALRAALNGRADITVASAGTEDYAHVVPPEISDYLMSKGLDVSAHRRRTLTREIIDASHLVIAMSLDHREYIRDRFGRSASVFLECCGGTAEALLDIHEAVPDFRTNRVAGTAYLRTTMDRIVELTPRLAIRIEDLLAERGRSRSGTARPSTPATTAK